MIKRGKKVIKYIGKSIILQEYSSERKKKKEEKERRDREREEQREGKGRNGETCNREVGEAVGNWDKWLWTEGSKIPC